MWENSNGNFFCGVITTNQYMCIIINFVICSTESGVRSALGATHSKGEIDPWGSSDPRMMSPWPLGGEGSRAAEGCEYKKEYLWSAHFLFIDNGIDLWVSGVTQV